MIAGINTETTRDAWVTVPGRSIEQTLNANGDPTQIVYKQGTTAVFKQLFTYDANNNVTKIECVTP